MRSPGTPGLTTGRGRGAHRPVQLLAEQTSGNLPIAPLRARLANLDRHHTVRSLIAEPLEDSLP